MDLYNMNRGQEAVQVHRDLQGQILFKIILASCFGFEFSCDMSWPAMQGLNHTSCGFLGFAEKNPRGPYIVGQGVWGREAKMNFVFFGPHTFSRAFLEMPIEVREFPTMF